jgi:hypothetical protein
MLPRHHVALSRRKGGSKPWRTTPPSQPQRVITSELDGQACDDALAVARSPPSCRARKEAGGSWLRLSRWSDFSSCGVREMSASLVSWVACVSLPTAPHSSRAIASESHGLQVDTPLRVAHGVEANCRLCRVASRRRRRRAKKRKVEEKDRREGAKDCAGERPVRRWR